MTNVSSGTGTDAVANGGSVVDAAAAAPTGSAVTSGPGCVAVGGEPFVATEPVGPASDVREWPLIGLLAFRWLAIYFALYAFPLLLDLVPVISAPIQTMWSRGDALLPWVGRVAFGLADVPINFPTGSGDTTADYVRSFAYVVFATVGTVMWTLMRRDVREYRTAAGWCVSALRYALSASLVSYGVAKVIPSQFPTPSAARLIEPFGALSPMGLLWAFTGASTPYQICAGFAELVPGVLLIFRRTALVGALIAVPVLTTVVLLNFTYDVPVKLYSSHLLLMTLLVLAPNARRLWCVLLVNRAVAPADLTPPGTSRGVMRLRAAVKAIALAAVAFRVAEAVQRGPSRGILPATDPLYGAWDVDSFRTAGAGKVRAWQALAIGRRATLRVAGDSMVPMSMQTDSTKGTLAFYATDTGLPRDSVALARLHYALRGGLSLGTVRMRLPDTLALTGTYAHDSVYVTLVRRDLSRSPLFLRGFHWVQEYPYNH